MSTPSPALPAIDKGPTDVALLDETIGANLSRTALYDSIGVFGSFKKGA